MRGGALAAATWCLVSGCVSCRGPALPGPKQLPQETLTRIRDLQLRPWMLAVGEERLLRRRIFQLEEEKLQHGEVVRRASGLSQFLELTIGVPPKVPCDTRPPIKASLKNLTDKKLRLRVSNGCFTTEVVSCAGDRAILYPADFYRADAVRLPRPEDFAEVSPGQTIALKDSLDYGGGRCASWLMPPVRCHVTVWLATGWSEETGLPRPASYDWRLASNTVAVEFVAGRTSGDLEAALQIDGRDALSVPAGERFSLRATLANRSRSLAVCIPRNFTVSAVEFGGFRFRRVRDGAERPLPYTRQCRPVSDGYTPWYPRTGDYVWLAPGKHIKVEFAFDTEQWREHGDFLKAGEQYEVRWHFEGRDWYIENGNVSTYPAWLGHLSAGPVMLRILSPTSAPPPRPA